ncbi:cysteine desulfurase [Flavilitoribacter nigricans]|uniref:Cysteine desulfurase n=1 Tax=Flavilitoribacter nigricans (strain ATCC 23147 / DSM 23189 / NBRC 102662 / NCIMB 1420 / SS-2) TaxID=1122177 RepID=A0A2D0N989_FLAN2|nr:cysteine desulfurase [Flavilitoribacter nigricans]PHN05091.1 cysteine desulfurase CsdA [Flavilitoribacter nigricans DSM 23189 = NBRC 102662]
MKNDNSEIQSIVDARSQFPNLNRQDHRDNRIIYLDNAATTHKPQLVIDSLVNHFSNQNANIHRGIHTLAIEATSHYEESRRKVQQFINAREESEVIFTSGTTAGVNLVAQTFAQQQIRPGDEILISILEHHSNLLPWQQLAAQKGAKLKVIPITACGELDMPSLERMLTSRVKILALTHISNSLGTINPIRDIIKMARSQGTYVLIDAAQSVGSYPIDVQDLDCDFLVFSGHKMYGPTGIGVLYGKAELLQAMPPWQFGGEMIRSVQIEKTVFAAPPHKFEAGTPPIAQAIALGAAIDFIGQVGLEHIQAQNQALLAYGTELLAEIPGLQLVGKARHKSAIISFMLEDIHPHDLATILNQAGVAVRAGHHCTQPLMESLGLPGTVRASMAFYNTYEDIDQLKQGLLLAKKIFT